MCAHWGSEQQELRYQVTYVSS